MNTDEDLPQKKRTAQLGETLDTFSVTELEQRINDLETEIDRVRKILAGKRAGLAAADAFFKR